MTLISHIESTLGQIEQGWSFEEGSKSVQVVRCRNQPFDSVVTYLTVGLSNFLLSMPQGRKLGKNLFLRRMKISLPGKLHLLCSPLAITFWRVTRHCSVETL
jgi:hypothetical protein